MTRGVRRRPRVFAVAISLALHGLLGCGLLLGLPPRRHPPTPAVPEASPVASPELAEDEPGDCQVFLVPQPASPREVKEVTAPPVAPHAAPVPPQTIAALPPEIPSAEVVAPTPPPPPPHATVARGGQGAGEGHPAPSPVGVGAELFVLPVGQRPVQKIVYVLDRSGSMGQDSQLRRAGEELLRGLGKLAAATQFQILVYNNHVEPLPRPSFQWRGAGDDNLNAVALALRALSAEGSTDHLPALHRAIGLRPDVIFFVTDADDLTDAQVEEATAWNAGKSVICTIELNLANRLREHMPLQRLARANGGCYRAVDLRADSGQQQRACQAVSR